MPATPTRIGYILRATRDVVATAPVVKDRYGEVARDTKDEPFECFFDEVADAQVICNARRDLLSPSRRRFAPVVKGALDLDLAPATPAARFIDDERSADLTVAVVSIGEDTSGEKTNLTVWG